MAGAVKVGPWGASCGKPCDISSQSKPQRLESITIYSSENPGGLIYGFAYVYVDQKGDPINVGPWGTASPGYAKTIKIAPGEHLNNVSGTVNNSGVTSLKLATNQSEYGPYGYEDGAAFSVPLQQGKGEVVAFFGRSDGSTLQALGVYVPAKKGSPVKVGPWGASSGAPRDINLRNVPDNLESLTVYSTESAGGRIYGFAFTYVDQKGDPIDVGPWGNACPGYGKTIKIGPGEHLTNVSGTANNSGITSLKLATNQSEYGPYGYEDGAAFSVPQQQGKGEVVAFFGRSDRSTLQALGVYLPAKKGSPVKVGPWGASSGAPRDINLRNVPDNLESFTVYSTESAGGRIYGFAFTYVDQNGQSIRVGLWGSARGEAQTFSMNEGEYVNSITGTADGYGVTSLKVTTNQDSYGPFGCRSETAFSVPLPDNSTNVNPSGAVVAFFGRSGDTLAAIGTYVGVAPN